MLPLAIFDGQAKRAIVRVNGQWATRAARGRITEKERKAMLPGTLNA
jgi:hypothetical protein